MRACLKQWYEEADGEFLNLLFQEVRPIVRELNKVCSSLHDKSFTTNKSFIRRLWRTSIRTPPRARRRITKLLSSSSEYSTRTFSCSPDLQRRLQVSLLVLLGTRMLRSGLALADDAIKETLRRHLVATLCTEVRSSAVFHLLKWFLFVIMTGNELVGLHDGASS